MFRNMTFSMGYQKCQKLYLLNTYNKNVHKAINFIKNWFTKNQFKF